MPNKPPFPSATITIDALTIAANIGIHPHEQNTTQPVQISLRALCRYEPNAPLCYEAMARQIRTITTSRHFAFLEELGDILAARLLEEKRIKRIWLRLSKPQALAHLFEGDTPPLVSVEILRTQQQKASPMPAKTTKKTKP